MLNVEDAWGTWYNEFIRICNKHAPLKDHKIVSGVTPGCPGQFVN